MDQVWPRPTKTGVPASPSATSAASPGETISMRTCVFRVNRGNMYFINPLSVSTSGTDRRN